VYLAAGGPRTCAVAQQHRLFCWGSNATARSGDSLGYAATPYDLDMNGIGDVTLGESHVCARRTNGTAVCWGDNDFGQLGNLTTDSSWLAPTTDITSSGTAPMTQIIQVVAGHQHACYLRWTSITGPALLGCWGRGEEGQLGTGDDLDRTRYAAVVGSLSTSPTTLPAELGLGWTHSCTTRDGGGLACWGDNRHGESAGTSSVAFTPVPFTTPLALGPTAVRAGDGFSCTGVQGQGLYCWGRNERGQLGDPARTGDMRATPSLVPGVTDAQGVAVGLAHVCVLATIGAQTGVWCWGANGQGQLGDGTLTDRRAPTFIDFSSLLEVGESFADIGAGEAHTCVSTTHGAGADGRVFCWGRAAEGQIGDNSFDGDRIVVEPPADADMGVPTMPFTASRLTPSVIPGIDTVGGMSIGRRHNCLRMAVGAGAEVRCWGLNEHGQLGDGTTTNRAIPTLATFFPSPFTIRALAAGGAHSCVLSQADELSPTSLACWGRNDASQIGNLGTVDVLTPFTVTQVTSVEGVAAGLDHTCVVTSQVSAPLRLIRCWGRNEFGQTGTRGFRANRLAAGGVRFAP